MELRLLYHLDPEEKDDPGLCGWDQHNHKCP